MHDIFIHMEHCENTYFWIYSIIIVIINLVSPLLYPKSNAVLGSRMSDSIPCISQCLEVYHHWDQTLNICKISLFSYGAIFAFAIIVICGQSTVKVWLDGENDLSNLKHTIYLADVFEIRIGIVRYLHWVFLKNIKKTGTWLTLPSKILITGLCYETKFVTLYVLNFSEGT